MTSRSVQIDVCLQQLAFEVLGDVAAKTSGRSFEDYVRADPAAVANDVEHVVLRRRVATDGRAAGRTKAMGRRLGGSALSVQPPTRRVRPPLKRSDADSLLDARHAERVNSAVAAS